MELTDILNNLITSLKEMLKFLQQKIKRVFLLMKIDVNFVGLFKTNDKFEISGAKLVDFWYENIKNYDFEKSDAKGDKIIANFTQVVHKASTKLGVGLAKNIKSGDVYLVANYQEKGN